MLTETRSTYLCEVCGDKYLAAEEALRCETSGVPPVEFDDGTEVVADDNLGFETHVVRSRVGSGHHREYLIGTNDAGEMWRRAGYLRRLDVSLRQCVFTLNARYGVRTIRMQAGAQPDWYGVGKAKAGVTLRRASGGISFTLAPDTDLTLEQAARFMDLAAELGLTTSTS